jgi:hypothetical protein
MDFLFFSAVFLGKPSAEVILLRTFKGYHELLSCCRPATIVEKPNNFQYFNAGRP